MYNVRSHLIFNGSIKVILRGSFLAILSAIAYGFIAFFSVPLMQEGLSFATILFYRFFLSGLMVMLFIIVRKKSIKPLLIIPKDLLKVIGTTFFYSASALTFMAAFNLTDSGIVITIQFCYPIVVVFLMVAFFGERFNLSTCIASILIVIGVAIFSAQNILFGTSGVNISTFGILLAIFSGITMASYVACLQIANFECKSDLVLAMYIMLSMGIYCGLYGICTNNFTPLLDWPTFQTMLFMALITGAISNVSLIFAVRYIGSSLTSVFGGLEVITGMIAGFIFLGERVSLANMLGASCILLAVTLVAVVSMWKSKNALKNIQNTN